MYNHAVSLGVDREKILCDFKSTNTRENFENSLDLILRSTATTDLAINYHMRRALLTAQHVLPKDTRIGVARYPSIHFSKDEWRQSERGTTDVTSA